MTTTAVSSGAQDAGFEDATYRRELHRVTTLDVEPATHS